MESQRKSGRSCGLQAGDIVTPWVHNFELDSSDPQTLGHIDHDADILPVFRIEEGIGTPVAWSLF